MNCPKCASVNLVEKTLRKNNLRVDYCPRCLGIWFDRGEVEQILPEAIKELAVPNDASKTSLHCPRCPKKPLYNFQYPQTHVSVDMCKTCNGLWFDDKKEIEEIHTGRKCCKENRKLEGHNDIGGIKWFLIRHINAAIDYLWALYPTANQRPVRHINATVRRLRELYPEELYPTVKLDYQRERQKTRTANMVKRYLCIVLMIGAIGFIVFEAVHAYKQFNSQDRLEQIPCAIKSISPAPRVFLSRRHGISWIVEYEYIYKGHSYLSSRYSMPRESFSYPSNQRFPYEVDVATICYIDPENPSYAVLVKSRPFHFADKIFRHPLFYLSIITLYICIRVLRNPDWLKD
jgi:Zn-finger nucleic acid-binding protein